MTAWASRTSSKIEDAAWDRLDAVFCCLPHGTTQEVVAALPEHLKVVDLSADFRLADPEVYAEWYGAGRTAPWRFKPRLSTD